MLLVYGGQLLLKFRFLLPFLKALSLLFQIIFYDFKISYQIYYQIQRTMKVNSFQGFPEEIQDQSSHIETVFDTFHTIQWQKNYKEKYRIQTNEIYRGLFTLGDQKMANKNKKDENSKRASQNQAIQDDKNLHKILKKEQFLNENLMAQQQSQLIEPYSFNQCSESCYKQTPRFKCLLQTPLPRFYKQNYDKIQQLNSPNVPFIVFKQIDQSTDPKQYISKASAYFAGVAMKCHKNQQFYEALYFYNLSCYAEPKCMKAWSQYINYAKRQGLWNKAFILSKTAFLIFTKQAFAQQYILNGEKCQAPIHELRGLLSSLRRPENYQRTIIQSARVQIKYRRLWRGVALLNNCLKTSYYKPSLFYGALVLAKSMQAIDCSKFAFRILEKIMENGCTKFQVYYCYIQMKLRFNSGKLLDKDIKFLQKFAQVINLQAKYKLFLCMAEIFAKNKNNRFIQYVKKAFAYNQKLKEGACKQKNKRQIYQSVASWFNLLQNPKALKIFNNDEQLIFYQNRARYIKGLPLIIYKFKNWKYSLHYALMGEPTVLMEAFQENNQGRLIAEIIHVMNMIKKPPLQVLKYWRYHIGLLPKSGELWCQGARLYLKIGQISNAKRCLKFAIHFTPQYGDSFFELLKVYLMDNDFKQVRQLKKNFLISQPYYGNVLSYLELIYYNNKIYKNSLNQVWQMAINQITCILYQGQQRVREQPTSCQQYNYYFSNPTNPEIREILFTPYEQIENRNARF